MPVIRQNPGVLLRCPRRDTLLYSFSGCDPDHGEAGVAVKISDISDYLNIPIPA